MKTMWGQHQGSRKVFEQIESGGVLAIVRLPSPEDLLAVAEAIRAGLVDAIEFTITTPSVVPALEPVRARLGRATLLGVGDILTTDAARQAIRSGAQFLAAPNFNPEIVALCREAGVPVIPGALTATEIVGAWEAGANLIKVFPAGLLGPQYIRALRGSLPHIPLLPAGGVSLDAVAAFIQAGAAALGAEIEIMSQAPIDRQAYGEITSRARGFVEAVKAARGRSLPPPPPIKPIEGPDVR